MLHEDRGRAESFGGDAERYDRARPGYPAALVAHLLDGAPAADPAVLDVGCGTGRVGLLFTAAGARVLGVEPDERMAQVARRRGLTVEAGRFERWDARGRTFDLIVSGQAWHWVDPDAGAAKAAAVLRPGGRVAVFWNRVVHDDDVARRFTDIYARLAPHLVDSIVLGHMGEDRFATAAASFTRAPGLGAPKIRRFPWPAVYTRDAWLDHVLTHSDHAALDPEVRTALCAAIGAAIDESGGQLTVAYETVAVVAARTAGWDASHGPRSTSSSRTSTSPDA